jgi:transcriptional regulator with XRE-family HTH domain
VKQQIKHFDLFDVEGYKKRLQLLRAMYDETQEAFARRLDIPFKRWNQYERGYPISRETSWLLRQKIANGLAEWIWFGDEDGLSDQFRKRLKAVERAERERADAKAKLAREMHKDALTALKKVKRRDAAE